MRSRLLRAVVLLIALSLLFAACGDDSTGSTTTAAGGSTTTAPTQLTHIKAFFGNYRPIQYYPYYLADYLGYFTEEGLQVELGSVSGSQATIQQLIAGNIDIGISSPAAALNAIASGAGDLVTYYTFWYRNIFDLVALKTSGITNLEGLRGKVVGVSEASGGEVPWVRGAMASAGLAENTDYTILPIGDGAQVTIDALVNNDAQAYSSSVFDIASINRAGHETVSIMPEQYAYVPSITMQVRRDTWTSQQAILLGFARAVTKAMVFKEANPQAAYDIIKFYAPELYEDPTLADLMWSMTNLSVIPPDQCNTERADRIGWTCRYIWDQYVSFMSAATPEEGGLPGTVNLDTIVYNDLIAQANDFDHAAVTAQAQNFVMP
jgi:NitT/TauT family transport system substrate-binding protein